MKEKVILLVVLGIIISSCSPKIPPPPPPPPLKPIANVVDVSKTSVIVEGKSLFENNCAKCHDLPKPKDFTKTEWIPIMVSMQKKSKISDEESNKIYAYLTN